MELSPNDIRNYEFPTQLRGYDKDEVDNFMEQVARALEAAKQEAMKLSVELESIKTQFTGLKQFEETIKNAAIDARRNADMTVANAKKEAEGIVQQAQDEANRTVKSRAQKIEEIESQITSIEMVRASYLNKLKNLIQSHMDLVQSTADGKTDPSALVESLQVESSADIEDDRPAMPEPEPKHEETVATAEPAPAEPKSDDDLGDEAETGTEAETEAEAADEEPDVSDKDGGPDLDKLKTIDPELAVALENYQRKAQEEQESEDAKESTKTPAPKPGEFVETKSRAEEIPPDFIPNSPIEPDDDSTDRVKLAPNGDAANDVTEHNTIDPDSAEEEQAPPPNTDLAKELDAVVAKFEEEMDRADSKKK